MCRRGYGRRPRILVELGPSAAADLHRGPHLDRLLLSVFHGSSGKDHSALLPPDAASRYRLVSEAVREDERSGRWSHRVLERVDLP